MLWTIRMRKWTEKMRMSELLDSFLGSTWHSGWKWSPGDRRIASENGCYETDRNHRYGYYAMSSTSRHEKDALLC